MTCHLVLRMGPVPKQQPIPTLCVLFFEQFEDLWYLRAGDVPRPLSQLGFLVEFAKPKVDDLAFLLRDAPENKL